MNTDNLAAAWAGPALFFLLHKSPHPHFLNHMKIIDHAHAIHCSIALIQLFQSRTGETVATVRTILDFAARDVFTVADATGRAILRFGAVRTVAEPAAPRAGVLIPHIPPTEAAVHPARGDQGAMETLLLSG
jgi:hypothetical protein